ncbi:MAG: phosphate acyltransferase [Myxococcota bacterium]
MSAERPRILFTDADDARVRAAVLAIADEGFARPLVLDPAAVPERESLATALAERRGLSPAAAARLLTRPTYLGLALLGAGRASALVAGANSPTGDVLIACDLVLGRSPAAPLTSSLFVLEVPGRAGRLVLADCAVNPSPDAEQLAAIAILAADGCRDLLGETPRVALLSFSSHGSATTLTRRRSRAPRPSPAPAARTSPSTASSRPTRPSTPTPRATSSAAQARSPAAPTCSSSPTSTPPTSATAPCARWPGHARWESSCRAMATRARARW